MKNMKEIWLYITKWKKPAWESFMFFYPNKIAFQEKSNGRDSKRWVIARSSGEKAEGLTRETGEFKVSKNSWYYTIMVICDLTHYGNNG